MKLKHILRVILPAAVLAACTNVYAWDGPTMGWSSWNTYYIDINDSLILKQAEVMTESGLKDAGYNYINIDDGYFGGRDKESGKLLIHPVRFPRGLKPVVDRIHDLGLKAGIYSDAGMNTCGCKYNNDTIATGVGLFGHEKEDAEFLFKDLGFDFIKIDYCGASISGNNDNRSYDPQQRYAVIAEAIKGTGRDDVKVNVCRWNYPGTWVKDVATSWRMSHDIYSDWKSVRKIILESLYLSAYAGEGHYNDMDMLEVGHSMSEEEDRTHFAMWCMMTSPLLIGCDMSTLSPETFKLLTNKELIAINQDPLGLQPYVVKHDLENETYVLVKDLEERNGTVRAVAFFNPNDTAVKISASLPLLELSGKAKVRDLINNKDLEDIEEGGILEAEIPARGCTVYKLTAEKRLPRHLYEAETAFLTSYQEIYDPEFCGTAYYTPDPECSGGMKVTKLGYRPGNDLIWKDVYCGEGGEKEVRIKCADFPEKARVYVSANDGPGQLFTANEVGDGVLTLNLKLDKGFNSIRLYNDYGAMPEIDYMEVY